jgi:hypothetical protein
MLLRKVIQAAELVLYGSFRAFVGHASMQRRQLSGQGAMSAGRNFYLESE